MSQSVTKAVLMFGGFQESEERQSGFEKGFFKTVRPFASDSVTVYHPRTWKTNVKNILRQLYENGIGEVAIITYSHGQSAAMDLARQAPKYGVAIKLLMCCDPIYRPAWAPRETWAQVFAIRAVIGHPTIKVPPSVNQVHSVIQDITKPSGHRLVAQDPAATHIHTPLKISLPHVRIDDSPTWWALVKMHLTHFCA